MGGIPKKKKTDVLPIRGGKLAEREQLPLFVPLCSATSTPCLYIFFFYKRLRISVRFGSVCPSLSDLGVARLLGNAASREGHPLTHPPYQRPFRLGFACWPNFCWFRCFFLVWWLWDRWVFTCEWITRANMNINFFFCHPLVLKSVPCTGESSSSFCDYHNSYFWFVCVVCPQCTCDLLIIIFWGILFCGCEWFAIWKCVWVVFLARGWLTFFFIHS